MDNEYNASSIKVMDQEVANTRFMFLQINAIAKQYKKPTDWVTRCIETCNLVGCSVDDYVARYITHTTDEDIPHFSEVFTEVLKEDSNRQNVSVQRRE